MLRGLDCFRSVIVSSCIVHCLPLKRRIHCLRCRRMHAGLFNSRQSPQPMPPVTVINRTVTWTTVSPITIQPSERLLRIVRRCGVVWWSISRYTRSADVSPRRTVYRVRMRRPCALWGEFLNARMLVGNPHASRRIRSLGSRLLLLEVRCRGCRRSRLAGELQRVLSARWYI